MRRHALFAGGLVVLLVLGFLYVANGDNIPVLPHDQLDDQVLCYKLAAEHFGESYYDEVMGGQSAQSMPVSIPGMLVFYLLFPAVTAFSINLLFVMVVAYGSLYATLLLIGVRRALACLTAFCFALLPFYSVYGLSSMGLSLVLCALVLAFKRGSYVLPSVLCFVYVAFSSLVWVGFAVCLVLGVILVCCLIRGRLEHARRVGVLLAVVALSYVLLNVNLILYVFGSGVEGHRAEFEITVEPFTPRAIFSFFLSGQYHCVSNHRFLAIADIAIVVLGGIWLFVRRNQKGADVADVRRLLVWVCVGLLFALGIAVFRVGYHSEAVVALRSLLPDSLRTFQVDRMYWFYPVLWYLTTGLAFEALVRIAETKGRAVAVAWVAVSVVLTMTCFLSARANPVVENAGEMIFGKESADVSWRDFYAEDLFGEIETDLDALSGGEDYRVLSVGLHPSVALYNGLSTLDGYSTQYPLSYKHDFARITQGELEKSPELYDDFWGWGSRCYAYSHELGFDLVIGKDSGRALEDFSFDTQAIKDMGGGYIISAVPIEDSREHGLAMVGNYASENSYYRLWVYEML